MDLQVEKLILHPCQWKLRFERRKTMHLIDFSQLETLCVCSDFDQSVLEARDGAGHHWLAKRWQEHFCSSHYGLFDFSPSFTTFSPSQITIDFPSCNCFWPDFPSTVNLLKVRNHVTNNLIPDKRHVNSRMFEFSSRLFVWHFLIVKPQTWFQQSASTCTRSQKRKFKSNFGAPPWNRLSCFHLILDYMFMEFRWGGFVFLLIGKMWATTFCDCEVHSTQFNMFCLLPVSKTWIICLLVWGQGFGWSTKVSRHVGALLPRRANHCVRLTPLSSHFPSTPSASSQVLGLNTLDSC